MTSAVWDRTPNLKLGLIEFNFPNWADDANINTQIIDAAMSVIGMQITGAWANNIEYYKGDLLVDTDLNSLWRCEVQHISAISGTFAQDRAAHPTYWTDATLVLHARGQWATGTLYYPNDVVYRDSNKYSWALSTQRYTSGASYDADVAAGKLVIITDQTNAVNSTTASKNAAASSATDAFNSMAQALQSEANAHNSEVTATTMANSATNSANTATNAATTAQGYAATATTQAGIATTQANLAQAKVDAFTYTYMSDTPPASPFVGQLWFETDTTFTYVYTYDGNSYQWVQIGTPDPAVATFMAGGFITEAPTDGQLYARQGSTAAWKQPYSNDTIDLDTKLAGSAVNGLVIPYYLYPNNPYSDTDAQNLVTLMHKYHDVPVLVVINPTNGPGTVSDGNYSAFIEIMQGAGGRVCGYVSTQYAARLESAVKADILAWKSLYPAIDGIFLDEQTWDTGPGNVGTAYVDLYKRYTDYAHGMGLHPVIANPGTNQQEAYFATWTADIILVHEQSSWPTEASMAGNYAGGHIDYSYTRRGGLVYNQPTLDTALLATLGKNVQWVYVTNDNLTGGVLNPWDTLPTYLDQLFAALTSMGGGGTGGGVTSVTGTAPVVSSGGTTPAISMAAATASVNGYLTSANWTTFNNKEPAITAGTGTQYYRGDKTWATLDTAVSGLGYITSSAADTAYINVSGDTMNGNLSLPNTGASSATTLNFGTAGTGMYGGSAAISFSTGGTQRLSMGSGGITSTVQVIAPATGTVSTTMYNFGTAGTGIYGDATSVNFSAAGVLGFSTFSNRVESPLPMRAQNGSISAPAYSFINDTNSGFYRNAVGDIRFALSGADALGATSSAVTTYKKLSTLASSTTGAGLNLPPGAAPSAAINGDVWTTTTDLLYRLSGTSYTVASTSFVTSQGYVTSSGVTSVTGTAPVSSSGGNTPAISMAAATTSVNGYLTSTDWNTFNGKAPLNNPVFTGDPQAPTPATADNDTSIATTAFVKAQGYVTSSGVTSVTGTAPVVSSGGATPAISMAAATASVNGYLSSTDFTTFNTAAGRISNKITVGTSAPGSPATNDLWVDTN